MEMCNMVDLPTEWNDVISLGLQQWWKKTLHANNLCRLVFGSTVLNLWRNRNELQHGDHPKMEEQLMQKIK